MIGNSPACPRCRPLLVSLALLVLLTNPMLEAQSAQRGRLEGAVRDADGAPLPGVTVIATSASLQGARRTATETGGGYVLRDLPRGDYTVLFEFPGLQSVEQSVVIEIGRTTRAEAVMDLAQFEDAVVVEAASPAVLDTTQGSANLTLEAVDSLAVERTPAIIAKLAPGVNDSPAYDQQVRISGGYVYDNTFLIEGHDVADIFGAPVAGVEVVTGPFIEDAIEETQVLTSAISAEHGRFGGGVVNMVTKSGGNDFGGTFRVDLSDPSWRDETPLEDRRGLTREGETAEVFSATLGGPVLPDKLWFFVAGRRNDESQTSTMAVSGAPRPSDFLDTRYQVKLTGNLGDSHSLQATWIDAELDGFTAFPWVIDPRAAGPQLIPNDLLVVRYSGALTPRLFVEAQASSRNFAFEEEGRTDRDPSDPRNSPFLTLSSPELWVYNHPHSDPMDPFVLESERVAASASWFAAGDRLGSHDLQFGIERFTEAMIFGGTYSVTGWEFYADYLADDEGQPIYDARGRFQPLFPTFSALVFEALAVPGARYETDTTALYLNDRWVLDEHWSFNLGLRYEIVSGQGTPGIETVDVDTYSPRLAVSLDPTGDGRFRLGAGYAEYPGKYHPRQFDNFTDQGGRGYVLYLYTGPPGVGLDFAPGFDIAHYIPIEASTREANLLAAGTHSAVNEEWTLSAGMQLPRGGFIEAIFVDRELTGILEGFITLDNGTTTLDVSGQQFVFDNRLLRNTSLAKRTYHAVHLQGRYSPADNWTIDGNWTWQLENDGNVDSDRNASWAEQVLGDYPEILPQERVAPEGRLIDFRRHQVRLWTNYAWGLGRAGDLDITLLYRYDSPRTFSLTAFTEVTQTQKDRDPGYAAPPQFQTVFFGQRGSQEFDDSHVFDLAARYAIRAWGSLEPWVKVEVRNLLNDHSRISWSTEVSPDHEGPVDGNGIPTRYIEGPAFGETQVPEDYVTPREYLVSIGVRF